MLPFSLQVYSHRDYCGAGLEWTGPRQGFVLGTAYDGWLQPERSWADEKDFVAWLAGQSDAALHGDGNQRITRARLLEFVASSKTQPPFSEPEEDSPEDTAAAARNSKKARKDKLKSQAAKALLSAALKAKR